MKKTVLYLLLLFFSHVSYGDEYWTSWMSMSGITSIAFEDSLVWCGTENGEVIAYNKITGEQQRFNVNESSLNNIVYCIAVDHNGTKWFGTRCGVLQFDGYVWERYPSNEISSTPGLVIHDIAVDNANIIWVAANHGILSYDGKIWRMVYSGEYHSLDVDSSGIVWAAGNTKILQIEDSEVTTLDIHEITTESDYIKDIAVDENTGLVWYSCTSEIYSFDFANGTEKIELDSSFSHFAGYPMIDIDLNGSVWFARAKYVALYRDGILENYYHDNFKNYNIRLIASDEDGSLWVANSKGLLSFDGETFYNHNSSGLYASHIASIVIDNDNTVWCSHMSEIRIDHLSYFRDGKWSVGPNGMYSLRAVDDRNVLWGAHYDLYAYDGNEIIYHRIIVPIPGFDCDTTSPGLIYDIYIDENNIIWIASSGWGDCTTSGIFTYDGETVVPKILGYFSSVTMDSRKNVWCGRGWEGLYKYDGNEWTHYTEDEGLPGSAAGNIKVDSNDVVWMSIRIKDILIASLASFDGETWTSYTTENSGLTGSFICSIAIDHNNVKWIGTDTGVSRFDGETWTTFNTENSGLCNNNVNAIAVEKNNTIWFGTENGISRYTGELLPASVDKDETKPEAVPVIKTYPNPFNPETTIELVIPETGVATLAIYNIAGQKVRELLNEHMTAGMHRAVWDGKDDRGNPVSAGVYIARLKAGDVTAVGKMALVK